MRLDENKYTKALQKWKDYSGNLISVLGKLWKDDIELIITTRNVLNRQKSVPLGLRQFLYPCKGQKFVNER